MAAGVVEAVAVLTEPACGEGSAAALTPDIHVMAIVAPAETTAARSTILAIPISSPIMMIDLQQAVVVELDAIGIGA
ncbi:hypothetical protein L3Q67_32245 [Saccharothrix sp. AJ9571]|nr:hypothetical protein L3Q67_32245 [Saccharothrix sp. AJ9571]